MPHEITRAFANVGLSLCRPLSEMLDEHASHRTERRGCGFTQATRFLSTHINQPADHCSARDLGVFQGWPPSPTEEIARRLVAAGWSQGWRNLDQAPAVFWGVLEQSALGEKLRSLMPRLREIGGTLELPESRLFMGLVQDLLSRRGRSAPTVAGMPIKPEIGSCSQAEEYFLEIAHGRVRRGGRVNLVVSEQRQVVMVEKIKLGESHSALVVAPLNIHGIWIPPGSLCALDYADLPDARPSPHGCVIPLSHIRQARFLRFTTLAVEPEARARAFSRQLEAQVQAQMLSPACTRLEQVREFAESELQGAAG